MNRKSIVGVLAAIGLVFGAGVASAQGWGGCGGYGGYYQGGGCGDCYGGKHAKWSEEDFKERMELRHKRMKEQLKITVNQEAAWNTFNEQMLALKRFDRPNLEEFAKLNSPERMEKRLEMMRQFQDAMAKRIEVVKTFYASLNAEQQKAFDDWHSPRWREGKRGW